MKSTALNPVYKHNLLRQGFTLIRAPRDLFLVILQRMKIHQILSMGITAKISFLVGWVCLGEAVAQTGQQQSVVVEVNLGPQESALVLEIDGETLESFEVYCRDDGQQADIIRNDNVHTCQGDVPLGAELSFTLRAGGGEMTATSISIENEPEGAVKHFEWIESGLHEIEGPIEIASPEEARLGEQPEAQPQEEPKSLPTLPFLLGGVAGLAFATALTLLAKKGGLIPEASLIGMPPDIADGGERGNIDATISELLSIGTLVIAHPESMEIAARDEVNIVSLTERDVVDLIDCLQRLSNVNPSRRLAVVVVGELEGEGELGGSFLDRLAVEAPVGSVIRVLK